MEETSKKSSPGFDFNKIEKPWGMGNLVAFVLFIVALSMPWWGLDIEILDINKDGWEVFGMLALVVSLVPLWSGLRNAMGKSWSFTAMKEGMANFVAGVLVLVLVLLQFFTITEESAGVDTSYKMGAYLGILVAAYFVYQGYMRMKKEGGDLGDVMNAVKDASGSVADSMKNDDKPAEKKEEPKQ
jgi:hypothetical protein